MTTSRLEAFSDGVFAIAITLLILEIQVPEETRHLTRDLRLLWPSYLGYVISFLLIGLIWANHHSMFEHIETADRPLLFLNTLLLMNVSFLPFVAGVLAAAFRTGEGQRVAVVLYGLTLVVGGIFFNAIWEYARYDHRLLGERASPEGARLISRRFMVGPVLYLVGTGLGALEPVLGLAMFGFLILFYWLPTPSATALEE